MFPRISLALLLAIVPAKAAALAAVPTLAVLATSGAGSEADASARPAEKLEFLVPESCGSADEFYATLEKNHHARRGDLQLVKLVLTGLDGHFQLSWSDEQGTRSFEDPDCRTLFRTALVLAITSLNEAQATTESSEVESVEASQKTDEGGAPPDVPHSEAQENAATLVPRLSSESSEAEESNYVAEEAQGTGQVKQHRRIELELAAQLGAQLGIFAQPSFGVGPYGTVFWGALGLGAGANYVPKRASQRTIEIGIELESWLFNLQLGVRPLDNLRLYLGLLAGNISGRSTGVSAPKKDHVWLLGPQLDLTLRLAQFGPANVEVGGNLWIAGNTPRFEVDPVGEIYRVSRFGGGIFLRGSLGRR